MAAHRRNLPAAPAGRRPPAGDDQAGHLARLRQACPSWLVLWSPWRRAFTGFACFTAAPVVIDEPRPDVFLARVREVERANSGPWPVQKISFQTPAQPFPQTPGAARVYPAVDPAERGARGAATVPAVPVCRPGPDEGPAAKRVGRAPRQGRAAG